jgi:hypothetical protein
VPAAGAIAAGGGDAATAAPEAPAGQLAPVQDSQAPDRRDGDCPERGGSESAPEGAGSDATAL